MKGKTNITNYSSAQVYNDTQESSPSQLILLLVTRSCVCVKRAVLIIDGDKMNAKDLDERLRSTEEYYSAIAKAIEILMALRTLVDTESGGSLASQLITTYTSLIACLNKARKEKSGYELEKISEALEELRQAWEGVNSFAAASAG